VTNQIVAGQLGVPEAHLSLTVNGSTTNSQDLLVGNNVGVGGTITAPSFYSTGINGYIGNGGALTNNIFNIYSINAGSLVSSNQAALVSQATVANASLTAANLTGTISTNQFPLAVVLTNGAVSGQIPVYTNNVWTWMTPTLGGWNATANQTNVVNYGVTNNNAGAVTIQGLITANGGLIAAGNIAAQTGYQYYGNGAGLTNIPPSAIYTVTNTSGVNGVINFINAEGTLYTNTSFTFQSAVVANPSAYQDFLLEITNSSGSLISISGAPGWFTNGTWNCTNISQLFLHEHVGMFTNAFMQPLK
jgi:hypothetical protein